MFSERRERHAVPCCPRVGSGCIQWSVCTAAEDIHMISFHWPPRAAEHGFRSDTWKQKATLSTQRKQARKWTELNEKRMEHTRSSSGFFFDQDMNFLASIFWEHENISSAASKTIVSSYFPNPSHNGSWPPFSPQMFFSIEAPNHLKFIYCNRKDID